MDDDFETKDLETSAQYVVTYWFTPKGTRTPGEHRLRIYNCSSPEEARERFLQFAFPDNGTREITSIDPMPVDEALDDDFETKDLEPPVFSDADITWWTAYTRNLSFDSAERARQFVFDTLEHFDTQSWAAIFGKNGPEKNREKADAMPVWQGRNHMWHIGQQPDEEASQAAPFMPVDEYLSNMTSDFSDGTNGEPSAPAAFVGDLGTGAGLPDYKYIDRLKAKHHKLKKLLKRREPLGHSSVAWDRRAGAGLKESEEKFDAKDLGEPDLCFVTPKKSSAYYPDIYEIEDGKWAYVGVVFRHKVNATIPALRQLQAEFPWTGSTENGSSRYRTRDEAVRAVWTARNKL